MTRLAIAASALALAVAYAVLAPAQAQPTAATCTIEVVRTASVDELDRLCTVKDFMFVLGTGRVFDGSVDIMARAEVNNAFFARHPLDEANPQNQSPVKPEWLEIKK